MPRLKAGELSRISFELNGRTVSGHAEPRMLLVDFIRYVVGATGTHVGCEHGVCGACTLRLDGAAVRSCLTFAVQANGRRVETVEGLEAEAGTLSRLQSAFRRHHALQCGFCTPGILMSLEDFLARHAQPSEREIREMLSGHLCLCTGYSGIVRAVLEVVAESVNQNA